MGLRRYNYGSKRTISTNGELETLQIESEPDTELCASEDADLYGGGL